MDADLTYDQRVEIQRSFMEAARKGDIGALAAHLGRGVDVNTQDWEGGPPALYAAFHNQPAALKFLIRAGAGLSLREDQGGTPLLWTIQRNAIDCVKVLIDGFAPLGQPNYAGTAPLDVARAGKRTEIARLLEEAIATEPARKRAATVELRDPIAVKRPLSFRRSAP